MRYELEITFTYALLWCIDVFHESHAHPPKSVPEAITTKPAPLHPTCRVSTLDRTTEIHANISMGAVSPAGPILLREGGAPPDAPQDAGGEGPPRRPGVAEGPRRRSLGPAGHVADPVGEGLHAVGEERVVWILVCGGGGSGAVAS